MQMQQAAADVNAAVSGMSERLNQLFSSLNEQQGRLARLDSELQSIASRKASQIALEAANPAYETRIFGPDRVMIQGRMVGLLRRY